MRRWILSFDLVSVVVFVAFGRATHEKRTTILEFLEVAAPFFIAMGAGWLVMRAWEEPERLRTGIGVYASTLILGLLLRRFVFDQGTAVVFVVVATFVLAALVIGWRVALAVTRRARERRRAIG